MPVKEEMNTLCWNTAKEEGSGTSAKLQSNWLLSMLQLHGARKGWQPCKAWTKPMTWLLPRYGTWKATRLQEIQKRLRDFLGQLWLASQGSHEKRLCRYSITQKHHLLACKYIEQCRIVAPNLTWCYGPESFMSMCIKNAAACVKGAAASKLPPKMLAKFAFSYHPLMVGLLDLGEERWLAGAQKVEQIAAAQTLLSLVGLNFLGLESPVSARFELESPVSAWFGLDSPVVSTVSRLESLVSIYGKLNIA